MKNKIISIIEKNINDDIENQKVFVFLLELIKKHEGEKILSRKKKDTFLSEVLKVYPQAKIESYLSWYQLVNVGSYKYQLGYHSEGNAFGVESFTNCNGWSNEEKHGRIAGNKKTLKNEKLLNDIAKNLELLEKLGEFFNNLDIESSHSIKALVKYEVKLRRE